MRVFLAFFMLIVAFFFINYGYYDYLEDADPEAIFFEKKYPTLQVKFYNIFANQSDGKRLNQLSSEDRDRVIAYCKYRLGIVTNLSSEEDLERCKYGNSPLHFRQKYLEGRNR